jgi:signal transduction histidine kinase
MKEKSRFSWRGLIPQFFILILLPLTVFLLAITFGGLALHRQAMRSLVGQRDERAVKAAAQTLTDQLNQRVVEVHMLASAASGESSPQTLANLLKDDAFLSTSFDQGMAFFTPDGQILASTGNKGSWKNLELQQVSGLENIFNPAIPPRLYAPITKNEMNLIFVAAPVTSTGPIAVGAFSPQTLIQHTLGNIFDSSGAGSAFVVTLNGQLLFSTGSTTKNSNLTTHPGVEAALQGQNGSTFTQSGSSEHVVAYSPVAPVGWALVIEEPWASVASPLLRTTEYVPLLIVPLLILMLIALLFVTRRIIQPLQGLEAKADELAWGNYDTIETSTGGIAEIRHLQAALIHLAHKVKAYQQGLRGYIGAITMGQEEERRRLARELHDDTLQSMIALNQRVQLAQLATDEGSERNSLAEIQHLTEETIQNLRRLTRDLRPIYLDDLGLVTALEMLVRETQNTSGIQTTFERLGTEARLSAPVELALYRIGQEALSNVVRHAQAVHAYLTVSYTEDSVTLKISDDGVGFEVPESPAEFAPSGHFGLLGIHERTEMIGAKLEILSRPSEGSQITVTVLTQNLNPVN